MSDSGIIGTLAENINSSDEYLFNYIKCFENYPKIHTKNILP